MKLSEPASEIPALPRKGDRVKLSAEGLRTLAHSRSIMQDWCGTVTGNTAQRRGLVRVKWDHVKEPHCYAGVFVELVDAPQ